MGKSSTNTSGMIAGAAEYGLDLYPLHFYQAVPRGPIDERGFNTMVDNIIAGLKKAPGYDGVLLSLHGAMVVPGLPRADAEIVRRVRKAMGARSRDIRRQFLAESIVLATVGGLMGVGAGWALAGLVAFVSPLPAKVTPWSVGVALSLGAGVGVLFGVYPAARAAQLDPIAALRQE